MMLKRGNLFFHQRQPRQVTVLTHLVILSATAIRVGFCQMIITHTLYIQYVPSLWDGMMAPCIIRFNTRHFKDLIDFKAVKRDVINHMPSLFWYGGIYLTWLFLVNHKVTQWDRENKKRKGMHKKRNRGRKRQKARKREDRDRQRFYATFCIFLWCSW